jgi:protein-tyrosine-phosphatase
MLTDSLVKDAPLVLTMTNAQRATVLSRFPRAKRQCFTLLEFAGDEGDINEPAGAAAEDYQQCAGRIESAVALIVQKLAAQTTHGK